MKSCWPSNQGGKAGGTSTMDFERCRGPLGAGLGAGFGYERKGGATSGLETWFQAKESKSGCDVFGGKLDSPSGGVSDGVRLAGRECRDIRS